jgi:CheY-like chemotaxis protein
MKIALVVADDPMSANVLQTQLKLLGYTTFIASTQARALNISEVCGVDVILITQPTRPHDRRSFGGELKSRLRKATIVLVTNCSIAYSQAKSCRYSGISAVMKGPPTLTALWRVLECEKDGFGCHPGWVTAEKERRVPLRISADR